MKNALYYNFRIGPEAMWLVINTVIGTAVVELILQFTKWQETGNLDDWQTWGIGFLFGLVRTGLGAILAAATGGGFQTPGQPAANEPPAP